MSGWPPVATPETLLATLAPVLAKLRPFPAGLGTLVTYHGSITLSHGIYVVDGPCCCEECDAVHSTRLVLVPARDNGTRTDGMGLEHVRLESITPLNTCPAIEGESDHV